MNKLDGPCIDSQTDILSETNKRLVSTRDKLLRRLISGNSSIENLDIQCPPGMAEELKVKNQLAMFTILAMFTVP